jgi:transcription termination factor NusB
MEEQRTTTKKKGGRPKKAVKKDQILAVKCSLFERRAIEARAKSVNLTVSEYLREMALTGKIDIHEKALPKEVLAMSGTLNHMAANLNQIAKKRNSGEELNALERATLKVLSGELKDRATQIKTYLQ